MALVTFNNKLVGSSNGTLTFGGAPGPGPVTQYTYFKLRILGTVDGITGATASSQGWMQLGDWNLYSSQDTEINVTYVSSYEYNNSSSEQAVNLFDGLSSTKWCSLPGGTSDYWNEAIAGQEAYAICQASTPVTLHHYTLTTASEANWYGRRPAHWQVLGSADGTNWTLIDERWSASELPASPSETVSFVVQENTTTRTLNTTLNKAGITTSKTNLLAGKKGVTLTAKSEDTVWEEQEEPSLGSGGY